VSDVLNITSFEVFMAAHNHYSSFGYSVVLIMKEAAVSSSQTIFLYHFDMVYSCVYIDHVCELL
jgi:hypothetical protein